MSVEEVKEDFKLVKELAAEARKLLEKARRQKRGSRTQ